MSSSFNKHESARRSGSAERNRATNSRQPIRWIPGVRKYRGKYLLPILVSTALSLCATGWTADPLPEGPIAQAEALWRKGQLASAMKSLDTFMAAAPRDPQVPGALLLKGDCLRADGREQEALDAWAQLSSRFPVSPQAPAALARSVDVYTSSQTRKNPKKSVELTNRLMTIYPKSPEALPFFLAEADKYFEKKKYSDFIRLLKPLEASLRAQDKERLRFAGILATGVPDLDYLLTQASESADRSDYGTAIRLYETALEAFATSPRLNEVKNKLGWCLFTRAIAKDQDRAETLWRQVSSAKAADEQSGEARWHLVQLYSGPKGKWREAADMCVPIAKDFAGTFRQEQALYTRAWLFWAGQDYAKAVVAFEDLIAAFPEKAKHPPIRYYLNDSKTKAGKR